MDNSNINIKQKNKGGRPKLSTDNLRSHHINIALTNREFLHLKRQANLIKKPISVYLREASLKSEIKILSPDFLQQLKQFNQVRSLVNQIAAKADYVSLSNMREARIELEGFIDAFKNSIQNFANEVKK
jgi:hypothetical protein